jgi:hypothetical protein
LTINYFNPVVPNWNKEAQQRELAARESCDFCLYVITPRMLGSYSIAEVVDDSNKRPQKTVFCVLTDDNSVPTEPRTFVGHEVKSLDKVREKAVGEEVMQSLTPGQQVVKIVRDELIDFLGGTIVEPRITKGKLNEIMLVGLQGSGKTSMCAKIGLMYKKRGYLPGVKINWDEKNIPITTLLKPYVDELKAKRVGELK